MLNVPKPPNNSVIELETSFDGTKIFWKVGNIGPVRYFIVVFLFIWLGGWSFGLISVIEQITSSSSPANYFLIFWLCGWSVGGLFAIFAAYSLLKPTIPESVTLHKYRFVYNSGSAFLKNLNPRKLAEQKAQRNPMKLLFGNNKTYEFTKTECPEFVLEGTGFDQRVYFDDGADRVQIGDSLKEPEREWLANVLQSWKAGEL